tara:strand:- start:224 stop:568 length:345 start_codon:yes stop_codon:yes gene_type:complete
MFKLIKYFFYLVVGLFLLLLLIGIFSSSDDNGVSSVSGISYVCSLGGEKSKIKISGSTAKETTAAGIVISYSNVNKTDKGAYTLEGSSQQGRAWFIGAQSYLLLDTQMIPYKCR